MFVFARSGTAAIFSLYCFAAPLAAQGSAEGWVSVGAITSDELTTGYIFGDFTLRAHEGQWGAELGMFGVVGRLHETYAAATWQRDGHKVELGFPRPAYDRYAISGLTQVMPRQALESISTTRSRATSGVFTESEFLPYGFTYGSNDIAFSLHGVPDTDIVVAGAGGRKTGANWQLDFGIEAVSEADAIGWNAKAQVIRTMGNLDVGLGLYAGDANGAPHVAELFAQIPMGSHLSLAGLLRQTQGDGPLAGAKLTYAFETGLLTDIAIIGGTDNLSIAASVGYEF
ncbi:hypothetical protein DS901_05125 [Loktanella sp. D2R18]|uniref:hypothetical protein n=1 Tax=Rhodobacterales TaxID=204455 RepID=UPI000DE86607|nr:MULTISPECIES: hypothetical protein [Rhodobacterales]MDO6590757.1 hypothetical protein [Yoonia sp. 1_MG-2023]RBW44627.1 hypothetical protein DS901_05125 [Loktanella sp. D2R18]